MEVGDTILTAVALSHSTGKMLFAGTSTGAMRSFKFPLTAQGEWSDSQGHGAAIAKANAILYTLIVLAKINTIIQN